MTQLILPGTEDYDYTLGNISLFWNQNLKQVEQTNGDGCWVYSPEGLPRWVDFKGLSEYLGGGEYDQREEYLENYHQIIEIEEELPPLIGTDCNGIY